MKKNMRRAMDRMEIDEGIRGLVKTLWKHGYRTLHSCEGHPSKKQMRFESNRNQSYRDEPECRYISLEKGTGDGWFEKNARKQGFTRKLEHRLNCYSGRRVDAMSFYAPNKWFTEYDFPDGDWISTHVA